MFKEFAKDYAFRLLRTGLQLGFGALAFRFTDLGFTDANVEQAVGAVMLLATLAWTGIDAWWKARSERAAVLLNRGQETAAKIVAQGGKEPKPFTPSRSR